MNADEYAAQQAAIAAATALFVQQVAGWFAAPLLSATEWLNMLQFLYPFVEQKRRESAELARTFYDFQRAEVHPELPRHDVPLEPYTFDWFVRDMEPARQGMQVLDAPKSAVTRVTLHAVRDVENAGRRQIIHAVETDKAVENEVRQQRRVLAKLSPEDVKQLRQLAGLEPMDRATWGGQTVPDQIKVARPQSALVRGWARVATGRETCSWCLMLISRGPTGEKGGSLYQDVATAGVYDYLTDEDVVAMYKADPANYFDDLAPHMDEWHTGCDCKVVPVFDVVNWPGKEAAGKARGHWREASKRAKKELRDNPDKQYYSFKDGEWQDTDLNREAINQLRKMIDSGEISTDWAAISLDSPQIAA